MNDLNELKPLDMMAPEQCAPPQPGPARGDSPDSDAPC